MFPIDLSAFNGPICKQQCFQALKDHVCVCVCVCVCVVKDGKGRKLAIHLFQKTKCWETRFLLQTSSLLHYLQSFQFIRL